MRRIQHYARDFWLGRVPLVHICLGICVAYLVVRVLPSAAPGAAPGALTYVWAGLALSFLLVLLVLVSVLAKLRHLLQDSAGLPGAALLSLGGLLLLISSAVASLDALLPDVPAIAPYVPPPAKVVLDQHGFVATGEIDYRMLAELQALVEANQNLRMVRLDSEGGNVHAGRAMGLFIARTGLETRVDGRCYSACTLAFAGGIKRQMGQGGQLGFHGYRVDHKFRQVTNDLDEIQIRDRDYLISRGVDAAFLARAYAVPASDIWLPERAELQQAGVLRP